MDFNLLKEEIKELLKKQIIYVLNKNDIIYINYNPSFLMKTIKNYLNKLKLNDEDYSSLINEIIKESLAKKYYIQLDEISTIINILSNKLNDYKLEYSDNDSSIYFHLPNNQSYLINYDEVENKWYLALINTSSLELIKEIYDDNYNNFINYLNNNL